jgi:hypothetical protein
MAMVCEKVPTVAASHEKLSTLIRRGSALRPEYREAYAGIVMQGNDLSTITLGTCPLGAAYEAATGFLPHDEMEQSELYKVLYQTTGIDLSRECLQLHQVSGDQLLPDNRKGSIRLDQFINFLSLQQGLTREEIADFLETAGY